MKRFPVLFLLTTLLTVAGAQSVRAQSSSREGPRPLYENAAEFYAHNRVWWRALSRQLTGSLDVPVERVGQTALQNVIYFATQYPDKVKLDDAVEPLLAIYRDHEQVEFRMMALAALHAIGDEGAMQELYRAAQSADTSLVHRMTIAAVNDFYHRP